MINNKIIIITKNNQFDKGWTLFNKSDLVVSKNRQFHEVAMPNIIKMITHSDAVDLILCEPCLSTRMVSEIEWVNKYIKLNIIAKNEDILERYSKFTFTSKTIDPSINFNYIGIMGKESGYYIFSYAFIEIDDTLEKVYFRKESIKNSLSFLKSAKKIILIDKEGKKDYLQFINEAKKLNIECIYATNAESYNKNIFDFALSHNLELLISNCTVDSIILENMDNTLSCVLMIKDDLFVTYPIENIYAYLGQEYKCCFYDDRLDTNDLKGELFSCYNGSLRKLEIIDKKIIPIDVSVGLMSDFIEEKFDSSITNSHNDYSAEAIKVEYQFTLIPPMIDNSYAESSIYDDVHNLKKDWNHLQTLNVKRITNDYYTFMTEDFGILEFIDEANKFTNQLDQMVNNCAYNNYYSIVNKIYELFSNFNEYLIEVLKHMFHSINTESSGNKFEKIDDEIAGYRQTIAEKNTLIEKGIEVLSNKRRVEILTKKINDLLELKKHFEVNSSSRNDKNLSVFENRCKVLLSNRHIDSNDDSIGNIVKPKEETKISKLEAFVDNHLYSLKKYMESCLQTIVKLQSVHIPEEYPVYDKQGQRYIVITDLSEYEKTRELCNEFLLKCITRR